MRREGGWSSGHPSAGTSPTPSSACTQPLTPHSTTLGLLQFIAPIMQFITGAWILGEPMPPERWVGFALVWVALAVLTVDSVVFARRARGVSDVAEYS